MSISDIFLSGKPSLLEQWDNFWPFRLRKPPLLTFFFSNKNLRNFWNFQTNILFFKIVANVTKLWHESQQTKKGQLPRFHVLFCLSHSFVYLLCFCPNWARSYDKSKINKHGCCLARKGHGNGVNATSCLLQLELQIEKFEILVKRSLWCWNVIITTTGTIWDFYHLRLL